MAALIKRFRKRYAALAILAAYIVICQSCMTMRLTRSETRDFFAGARLAYHEQTLVIDGVPMHYIETGNPDFPTLFFVHGSPGSWDAFRGYLSDSLLLRKFRMIAVDRPGFGESDFGTAQTLRDNVRLLSGLAKKTWNGRHFTLIGHSIGGPVVVQMAADHPELVDNLFVLAGSVDAHNEAPEKWRRIIMTPPLRYLIPGALRTSNDEVWFFKKELGLLEPRIQTISCNVTVIHGTADPLVPYGNATFLKSRLTNAQTFKLIPIEGANHFIPWEHYALIRDELLKAD